MSVKRYELVGSNGCQATVTVRSDGTQATIISMEGPPDQLLALRGFKANESALLDALRAIAAKDRADLRVVELA